MVVFLLLHAQEDDVDEEGINHALLDSASKGCGSGILRMRRKKRKGEWGNDKVVVERERDCV